MFNVNYPAYTISVAARLLNVHPRTLRLYEQEGFIRPARNPNNNHRLYSDEDIERIKHVRLLLKKEGLNIKGLKALLGLVPCWKITQCIKKTKKCSGKKVSLVICWLIASRDNPEKFEEQCRNCCIYLTTKSSRKFLEDKRKCMKVLVAH